MALPLRPPAPIDPRYVDLTEPTPTPTPTPAPAPAPAAAHPVELVETGAFAHAACSACEWTGPARRSRALALADLDRHP